jgi:hypothetical protein
MLAPNVLATKARGNPPRSHRSEARRMPTSSRKKPSSWWKEIRPAKVSDVWRSSSREALPSIERLIRAIEIS